MGKRSIICIFMAVLLAALSGGARSAQSEQENSRPRRATGPGPRLTMEEVKSYEQAIDRTRKLLMTVPYYFDGYYNIARIYALLGQKKDALDYLGRAVEKGMIDTELIEADQSLQLLRDEPEFQNIVKKSVEKVARVPKEEQPFIILIGPDAQAAKSKKALPLLITLHGEAENALAISTVWRPIADSHGFVLAAPQGKYLIADGHYQWGRRADAEALVLQAIERAKQKYQIDQNRIYLMGFSQGGYLSLSIGLSRPDLFAGVIAVAPYYVHSLVASKLEKAKARSLHVYLGNGEKGYPNLLSNNREAKRLLEEAGLKVELKLYRDTGHALPSDAPQELEEALKWVDGGR
jgi:phospholipase/carboxylesterase